MNGRAILGAYIFRLYVCDKEMSWPHHIGETHQPDWVVCVRDSEKFRLTNVIPERIIFVSRGITVLSEVQQLWLFSVLRNHERSSGLRISLFMYGEVLLRVNEKRNILHEIRKRKANWIVHILRGNCLLKHIIVGKIKGEVEVTNLYTNVNTVSNTGLPWQKLHSTRRRLFLPSHWT